VRAAEKVKRLITHALYVSDCHIRSPVRLIALLAAAAASYGQQQSASVPVLSPGNVQLSAFGGFNLGQSFTGFDTSIFNAGLTPQDLASRTSNGSVGGAARVNVTARLTLGVEVSYVGGGHLAFTQDIVQNTTPPLTQISLIAHSSGVIATGGGRYMFPISRRNHFIPYLTAAGGALIVRDHLSSATTGNEPNGLFSGLAVLARPIGYAAVGADYYFSERAGLTVEGGPFRAEGFSTFARLSVGVFVKIR
jgi:hypothetical protein